MTFANIEIIRGLRCSLRKLPKHVLWQGRVGGGWWGEVEWKKLTNSGSGKHSDKFNQLLKKNLVFRVYFFSKDKTLVNNKGYERGVGFKG